MALDCAPTLIQFINSLNAIPKCKAISMSEAINVSKVNPMPVKALIGEDGWLFLDNDANRSVDQYMGRFPLPASAERAWKIYFDKLAKLREDLGFRFVQLFAPSKEIVYEDYYPHRHQRAAARPVDTVIALAGEIPVCFPWEALRPKEGQFDAYDRGDTHWNLLGAAIGGVEAVKALGLAAHDPYSYKYYRKVRAGDLDSKIEGHPIGEQVFAKWNNVVEISFDSEFTNRGRIIVLNNPDAAHGTLMIFGDSFGNRLQLMLRDVFRRIVYVHGHSVDAKFIAIVKPDYIISEMVDRFVVNPPSDPTEFSILDTIREKAGKLTGDMREALVARYIASGAKEPDVVNYLLPAIQ